jgi:hypoxia induced protein
MKEEPLIPLGMTLTVIALVGAGRAIRAQDHARANIMFRRRIYAQGFTLLSVVAGSAWLQSDRAKRKESEALQKERENAERREKWVKELEGREEEDRAAREKVRGLVERRKKREEEIESRRRREEEEDGGSSEDQGR